MKNLLILLPIIVLFSCQQQLPYDVKKWNDESDRTEFAYRKAMIDDLLENHNPKGMNLQELEELFGYIEYDSTSSDRTVFFEIDQEWDGIDPSYTKYLVLRLNKQLRVDSVYFEEYNR